VPIKRMQRYLKIGTDGVVRAAFAIDVTIPAAPKLQVASRHCSARPPLLRKATNSEESGTERRPCLRSVLPTFAKQRLTNP
jgi:hypothetical protein